MGARAATPACRSVVGEGDSGQGFYGSQGSVGLGRDKGPTPGGIGIHDGAAGGRGHSKAPVADTGDGRHIGRAGCVSHLSGEDSGGLVREYRDSGISTGTTGELADDSAAWSRGLDRAAVRAAKRSLGLGQRRAGSGSSRRSDHGCRASGWHGARWRICGGRRRCARGRAAAPRPTARQDHADYQSTNREGNSPVHGSDHRTRTFIGQDSGPRDEQRTIRRVVAGASPTAVLPGNQNPKAVRRLFAVAALLSSGTPPMSAAALSNE